METEEQEKIEERKEKVKNWLSDPHKLILIGILAFAFMIRFYYFLLTKTQPLWWDELAYGSLAKNFVYHSWDGTSLIIRETLIRAPLLPFLWSLLIRININEVGVRFLLEFIPSILSIFFVYLVGKEFYNKQVGLISAFVFSVLWIHLFYTARLLTNVPALPFLFLSIYYFIKSQKEDFNAKYFGISLVLLSLATLIRYPIGIVFFSYLLFLIITKKFYLIKKPRFWVSGILGIVPILLFFTFNLINSGNIFPAFLGGQYLESGAKVAKPIAFSVLNYIPIYLKMPFFIFFIMGTIIVLFELILGYDLIKKKTKLKSYIIILLVLIFILSFFIFYTRAAEDRWLFPTSLSMVYLTAIGVDYIYNIIKKYSKAIAIIALLAVLFFGAYQQITFANQLIKIKKQSYLQMRLGFEWIKQNVPKNSVISGQGIEPYTVYYAEMQYEYLPKNMSEVDNIKADYLVVHSFTEQPPYINEYLQNNQDKWQPIHVLFFDAEQKQPAFVLFKKL